MSASDKLRYCDKNRDVFLGSFAQHGSFVTSPPCHFFKRQAALAAEREYLFGKLLSAEPYWVSHICSCFDNHVSVGFFAFLKQFLVENHLFTKSFCLFLRKFGEFKNIASRHHFFIKIKLGGIAHFNSVKNSAHFMIYDCRACRYTVDNTFVHKLSYEGCNPLVKVRPASRYHSDLSATLLSLCNTGYGTVESLF